MILSGRFLLAAAPGLFVTLGASYPGHYIAGYQYGTLLLLAIFLCFPMGWQAAAQIRRRVRGGGLVLAGGVICASVSVNALWGNFFAQNYAVDYVNPRVGSGTYLGQLGTYSEWPFEPGRVRDVRAVREKIPAQARVAASFHLVPHFSSRRWVTAMESENAVRAEYLILDPTSLLRRDREALPALLESFEAAGESGPIRWYRRRGAPEAR